MGSTKTYPHDPRHGLLSTDAVRTDESERTKQDVLSNLTREVTMLGIGCYVATVLTCATCGATMSNGANVMPALILMGRKYQYCPTCGREIHQGESVSHRFKVRWTKTYKELVARARKEMITIRP